MARLLLVDDDPDQLKLRRMVLEKAGHSVTAASAPAEALAAFEADPPDMVLMDLGLPRTEDGVALIRKIRKKAPEMKVAVISGDLSSLAVKPEAKLVDAVLAKPVRSQRLLQMVSKLALWVLMLAAAADAQPPSSHPFQLDTPAEVVADLDLSAPGGDWGRAGREGVLAVITLGEARRQNVMVFSGGERHKYSVFLGPLEAGAHQLRIERHPDQSSRGIQLQVHAVTFRQFKPGDADYPVIAHAPVIFARPNTIGKFTDIPLVAYCERLADGSLRYSVIFSNEDGGTSTRGLMARWGRVTDIEHVYQVWLDPSGKALKAQIQTRDHKDVDFRGKKDGHHPLLGVVTDNNMVDDTSATAVRYQLAPLAATLTAASREQVMDDNPITYLIASRELEREGKLRKFATVEGTKISAPENYLHLELRILNKDARLAVLVRLEGENFGRSSNLGVYDLAIERSGWVRTAVELPPATQPPQVAEIGLQCLPEARTDGSGVCRVEAITKMFFLDAAQKPSPSFFRPRFDKGPWVVPAGHLRTIAVR